MVVLGIGSARVESASVAALDPGPVFSDEARITLSLEFPVISGRLLSVLLARNSETPSSSSRRFGIGALLKAGFRDGDIHDR